MAKANQNAKWDRMAALKQLSQLSGIPIEDLVPSQGAPAKAAPVEGIEPSAVSAVILEELSLAFSDYVNFLPEVELLKAGRVYDAYVSVQAKCSRQTAVCPITAWALAQAKACVSKLSVPELRPDAASHKMWWEDEHRCKRVNSRLTAWISRFTKVPHDGAPVKVVPFLREVTRFREFIAYVLGDEIPLSDILSSSRYGPGTSYGVRGDATHYADKLLSWDIGSGSVVADLAVDSLALDKGAWEVIGFDPRESTNPSAIEGFKREARKNLTVAPFDRLLFVFKNAKAVRSITVQPTLSGMVQLGIDAVLKRSLLARAKIDLTSQDLNRRLAREGSKYWDSPDPWCTIDKSSASNLVCKRLISFGFPSQWSKLLWATRSSLYEAPPAMGGAVHTYQMYAGMGNGTTFGVESLIFAAIAYATSDLREPAEANTSTRHFNVFGDDVILRKSQYSAYIKFAAFLGFRINHDKSFSEGPFRESCGADYWAGVNVRPAYVNGERKLNELDLVGIHNTIMDSKFFVLLNAAKRLRSLWKKTWPWPLPSDPQGGLGFRTTSTYCYDYARTGNTVYSTVWQRPRGYTISVSPVKDELRGLTPYVSLNVALLGGFQKDDRDSVGNFALPFRRAIKIRIVPEKDLRKKDLVQMLTNQLLRLASRKSTPWYKTSRGN